MKHYLAFAAILLGGLAVAQSSTDVLTWTLPTNTDGSAIQSPITYNIYSGSSPTTIAKIPVRTGVPGLTTTFSRATSDPVCYTVATVAAGQQSVQSVAACKTPAVLVVGPPATVSVQ